MLLARKLSNESEKIMKKYLIILVLSLIPIQTYASSYAVDDFDDGILDSLWTLGYDNTDVNNVIYSEDVNNNSMFVPTKIVPLNPAAKWTSYYFSKYMGILNAMDDFHIDFTQTIKQTDVAKLPYYKLMLRDTSGSGYMMTVGYEDKSNIAYGYPHLWIENTPGIFTDDYVEFGETSEDVVLDWDITRENGILTVYLNGEDFIDPFEQPYYMSGNLAEIRIYWQGRYVSWPWDADPIMGLNLFRIFPRKPTREINWTGSTGTAWMTNGNWSDSQIPDQNSVVTINASSNNPVLPTGIHKALYVDVNSGSLEVQGILNSYSMEVDQGGVITLAAQDANIILNADQRLAINKLITQGRIVTSVANTVIVASHDTVANQTIIKLIVPQVEKVLDWTFNDGSGLIVSDLSGKGNNGSLLAFNGIYPQWDLNGGRSGEIGDHALSFNDPNATVKLINAASLPTSGSDAWTMNVWAYLNGSQDDISVIAGFGDIDNLEAASGSMRYIRSVSGNIAFYGLNASIPTTEPWDINKWQMLTVTCDYAGVVTLYKNGYRIGSAQLVLSDVEPIVYVSPIIEGLGFRGKIDDFSIYTYPMSQKEIVTDLWGSWICGLENKSQPAWDLSGNCIVDFADLSIIGLTWIAEYDYFDLDSFSESWLESGRVTGSDLQ